MAQSAVNPPFEYTEEANGGIMKKEREINLDIIRCLAVIGVLGVHFFLNTSYYQTPITNKRMVFMTGIRTILMCCVPLFLLLTGYLMSRKKEISIHYYKGIRHTLGIYILVSICCLLYKNIFWGQGTGIIGAAKEILAFSADGYSWYIEMYIGLFLMIPFLNILYSAIPEKTGKKILLCTLLFMTVAPTIFDFFGIKILPEWWENIWPLLYYFVGAYIREYHPKPDWKKNILLLAVSFLATALINTYANYGNPYQNGVANEWWGWMTFINSVLLFILIKNLKTESLPLILKKIITKVSQVSLGIYLCSWMADQYVYPIFNQYVPEMDDKLNYYPLIVGIVFLISFILAFFLDRLYNLIEFIVRKIFNNGGGKAHA